VDAADQQAVPPGENGRVGVQGQPRAAFQERTDGDGGRRTGEWGAQAVVDSVAEGQVSPGVAANVRLPREGSGRPPEPVPAPAPALGAVFCDLPCPAASATRAAHRMGQWPDGRLGAMQKLSLEALAREHLERAATASAGRSAETVYGGHDQTLRQTLIAMKSGTSLAEHDSPGEATLLVLRGRVRLRSGDTSWDGMAGDLVIIPQARHSVDALEDAAFLLSVAKLG
jgi:quercetin dioxygenase-like cupin family protein